MLVLFPSPVQILVIDFVLSLIVAEYWNTAFSARYQVYYTGPRQCLIGVDSLPLYAHVSLRF